MWDRDSGDAQAREAIVREGMWLRPSAYGDPYPITRRLIEDGRRHLILRMGVDIACPVRILHGDADPDVPWQHALRDIRGDRSATMSQFTLDQGRRSSIVARSRYPGDLSAPLRTWLRIT